MHSPTGFLDPELLPAPVFIRTVSFAADLAGCEARAATWMQHPKTPPSTEADRRKPVNPVAYSPPYPHPLDRQYGKFASRNVGVRSTTDGKGTDGLGRRGRNRGGWLLRLRVLHAAPDHERSRGLIRADSRRRRQGKPRQGVVRPEEPHAPDRRYRD